MRGTIRRPASLLVALTVVLLLGTSAITLVSGEGVAAASGATASCPNVGKGEGCAYVITVNAGGTASIAPGTDTKPYGGAGHVVVGVVNDASGMLESVSISETKSRVFAFHKHGICTYSFTGDGYCDAQQKAGVKPYAFEGPDNTFTWQPKHPLQGVVDFDTALAPGGTTYFSLAHAPSITGTTLSAVLSAVVLTGSPVDIPPQVTNQPFTTEVATFTSTDTSAPASDFSATIDWGDGSAPSTGTVSGSSGSFTVDGTHTYALDGTTPDPVTVTISDVATSVKVTDNQVMVADSVTSCSGTCTGTVDQNNVDTEVATNANGFLLLSSNPNSGSTAIDCGDGFRHAPTVTTETNTFNSSTNTITATFTFPESDGTQGSGPQGSVFWVCFQSNVPFTDAEGQTTTLGLLPLCYAGQPPPNVPCMYNPFPSSGPSGTNITEKIVFLPDDPRWG
jgi:hypothetical protein